MKWVREYIFYFGGDANRVTIGGMSAGGQSIQVHLMAPSSWPFFNRAISISGPTGVPLKNAEESGNCSSPSQRRTLYRNRSDELTNEKVSFYENIASSVGCCFGKTLIPGKCRIFNVTSVYCLQALLQILLF